MIDRSRRRERGAALVEFALIVPLLSMFLFGIVQFGLAYDKKQSINAAAREGSRTGAIPANTVKQIEDAVHLGFNGLTSGVVTTTVRVGTTTFTSGSTTQRPCEGNVGMTVIVEARVNHVLTIPFLGAPTIGLLGRGQFRCEGA